ncbi:oligopeptide ABC transporter substrate-binding protein [Vaginisenegalia massiliensis]|uniref:oligopeptide ABC transporter substrate-binding protein n=1 Tax=Vaginisenegalia massiliensis TaxID=2058294 RepID=UPI000F51E80B|nr:oligopeptide ABC transporter substrate-binding protein [Vaginisenegalia massiliensis]
MNKGLIKLTTAATILAVGAGSLTPIVKAETPKFQTLIENKGKAIKGGQLRYALVGDPFPGVLSPSLYDADPDGRIIDFFNPGLIGYDENFHIDDSGFGKVAFDKENKQVTITIPKDTKWDDGQPLTIDDVIQPYLIIGHPDYTGVRYNEAFANVVGMDEYHSGKAKEISGLERVDDYTLKITYKNFSNSMTQAGGSICSFIEPAHILKDIPVKDLQDSEAVRKKPVGFGPFKVKTIVPGESVTLEANEYYYKGKPKMDSLVIDVVNQDSIVQEMKAGNYDIATLPADQYQTFKDAKNFKVAGNLANVYTYIGFMMGKWDAENKEVKMDPNKPVSNKAVRQAMAYAIDTKAMGEKFYFGLRLPANSPITPNFTEYNDKSIKPFKCDPEKSKQILAKAGFKDKDGDGFVEDPKGKPFKLSFAAMQGGETAEPLAQYFVESWKQIGLNVELTDGRLLEMNSFYDRLDADDPKIDVFQAAMTTGGDPNPEGQFGRRAKFNQSRWATEENDKLIEAIMSDKSFEKDFRVKAFQDWQKYVMEELPVIPTLYRYELTAVNNRVSQWDVKTGSDLPLSEIELLSDKPIK